MTSNALPAAAAGGQWRTYGRKRRIALALAATLIVVAVVFVIRWWTVGRFVELTDDAYVGGNVTQISPHVAGYVAQILVRDNQFVRAGTPLVRLDAHDYQAALTAAQAGVLRRTAALGRLHAQQSLEQALIRQAQAELAAEQAKAHFANLDAQRYRHLAQTQAGTRQDAERAHAAARTAHAEVAAAEAGVRAAGERLAVTGTRIAEAQAALAQAGASLATARLDLGYTELRAPVDGYVADRSAHPGTYVSAGTPLLSIVPARGLWVDANFKEDQLHDIKPGDPVDVVADALPGTTFRGHVQSLSPATGAVFSVIPPQNATGNFTKIVQRVPVRIALDGKAAVLGALRPGLSTSVSVDTRGARMAGSGQ
ncbi:hemolysin D [Pandoraea thiooxydans]|uniref:Hemolysin D n=1 Tax=Pandoraea thiooxydans TaxID=445709 RepID=A0A0G3ETX6_9BURK|nr:hemolysin D [Pandoraea thiooxydans]